MPGPYLLYQGEELGQEDLVLSRSDSLDPIAVRTGEMSAARDCARSPMPWTAEPDRGFGSDEPWLPHGPLPVTGAADAQAGDSSSHLSRWREAIGRWSRLRDALPEKAEVSGEGDVVVVRRGPLTVVTNAGDHDLPLAQAGVTPEASLAWRSLPGSTPGAPAVRAGETVWCLLPDAAGR
jgi:alpha-glucosidase